MFITMYVKVSTSGSQSGRILRCILGPLGVIGGIHMSENNFGLGGVQG